MLTGKRSYSSFTGL